MRNWLIPVGLGVLAVIAGFIALANPFAASLAATTLAAWFFVIVGALLLFAAFRPHEHAPDRVWTGLTGAFGVLAGIYILADPLAGLISLTLAVALLFLAVGITRLWLAWSMRETRLFWVLLISGALSVLLGGFILVALPAAALGFLGLLLAVELLSSGASMIVLGLMSRDRGRRP